MHDFTNFNDLCLKKNTNCKPIFLMRKNKLNLFFYNIDFWSVQEKIPWNCIYLKISFENFLIGNPEP